MYICIHIQYVCVCAEVSICMHTLSDDRISWGSSGLINEASYPSVFATCQSLASFRHRSDGLWNLQASPTRRRRGRDDGAGKKTEHLAVGT